jgi:beta-glucosidase
MGMLDMLGMMGDTIMKRVRVAAAFTLILADCALIVVLAAPPDQLDARVDALLSQMTLAEKLGQLQQLDGSADGSEKPEHAGLIRKGLLGSTLNVRGAARTNALQRIAMEQFRLAIPLLFAYDVIHGYRTIFPIPLGLAATWDPAVIERVAAISARESRAAGIRWTFAPMVDIARDPRWGRIAEGAGEDPYLGASMAAAWVRGFQGDSFAAPERVLACAKHWVAYGAAEGGRDYNTVDMSERTLREIYFPPFKAAVDAGVATLMSAFNDLNGIPATANRFTLTDVLRGEWAFRGFVVSDYNAVRELLVHGIAVDDAEAAREALTAGVDMEMVSRTFAQQVPTLIERSRLATTDVDRAVRRVLRLKIETGLFENPYTPEGTERTVLLHADHRAAASDSAARSFVLLKNEDSVLPLATSGGPIAVIGPLADDQKTLLGPWSADGNASDAVSLLTGLRARLGSNRPVAFARGCGTIACPTTEGFGEAVTIARKADVIVLAVGESADMSGEAASRSSLDLPGQQLELVKSVQAVGKPVIVVLMNGRPLTVGWLAEHVSAILETWFAGTEGGTAIAAALVGDVTPGGKLPATFPRAVGQVPLYYNHKHTGRPPGAPKYTSKYLDVDSTPLFPFGFGLSYSSFRLSNLQLDAASIPPDGSIRVGVDVENTGARQGDEVVQVYLTKATASVTPRVETLAGFRRVTLRPGARQRLSFQLGAPQLGMLDRELRFGVTPGAFQVTVGTSSVGGLKSTFTVSRK